MSSAPPNRHGAHLTEPPWVRWTILAIVFAFLALFLVLPLVAVFTQAFAKGVKVWLASFDDPTAWSAIRLTLEATVISVVLNTVFGVAAAWAIAKFHFRGKTLLVSLIDLPFAVSPVVA